MKDDWEEVGKDAFYRANRQGLANDDRIIEATKVTKAAEAIKAAKSAKSAKRNRQAPTGVMPI